MNASTTKLSILIISILLSSCTQVVLEKTRLPEAPVKTVKPSASSLKSSAVKVEGFVKRTKQIIESGDLKTAKAEIIETEKEALKLTSEIQDLESQIESRDEEVIQLRSIANQVKSISSERDTAQAQVNKLTANLNQANSKARSRGIWLIIAVLMIVSWIGLKIHPLTKKLL